MNKRIFTLATIIVFGGSVLKAGSVPENVALCLSKAGKNYSELEKAINYFKRTKDPFKLKAIYFLIGNIDAHHAANYYWADDKGKRLAYDEFSFTDFNSASKAAKLIREKHPGAHMVPELLPDITTIKGDFLIQHINVSFSVWKNSAFRKIPFNDFCEYILPYRVSVEPIQNWLPTYQSRFKYINSKIRNAGLINGLGYLNSNLDGWFLNTFNVEKRIEPLPRLGAMQLLFRKKGPCEDIADLSAFILRSQGVPVTLDIIPFWATSTGSHFTTTVFDPEMHPIRFDLSRNEALSNNSLSREPAKVIRMTFSKQLGTLASFENIQNIPEGFMRNLNYIDVTSEYWQTTDVTCKLFPVKAVSSTVYSCVLNGLKWKPAWWGRVKKETVTFSKLSKGAVYLPQFYQNGKFIPAGYPIAVGYHHEQVLAPDKDKPMTVTLKQESGFLTFKGGKNYKLYYWDNRWQLLAQQKAGLMTTQMAFSGVPRNSLLLLLPEYSKKKERPFFITDDGKRNWF